MTKEFFHTISYISIANYIYMHMVFTWAIFPRRPLSVPSGKYLSQKLYLNSDYDLKSW